MPRPYKYLLLSALCASLVAVAPAGAIDKCKVKVDKKTGVIRVDAAGVVGSIVWGPAVGEETEAFFNAGSCVAGDKAKKCELADPATAESKSPSADCTMYLADDGATDCQAWIPGCTPGVRGAALSSIESKVACISDTSTATDIIVEGCNLHVRNDSGSTAGAPDGFGNVIVGWNEASFGQARTGSHNVVVGREHAFSKYGGAVIGYRNSIAGNGASVTGGTSNAAVGPQSSVSGGLRNTAGSYHSSVSGGIYNTASGFYSSVSGGYGNIAMGPYSSVSGGYGLTQGSVFGWTGGSYSTP